MTIPNFIHPIMADQNIKSINSTFVGIELRLSGDIDIEQQRQRLASLGLEGAIAVTERTDPDSVTVPGEPTPPYIMGLHHNDIIFVEIRQYR